MARRCAFILGVLLLAGCSGNPRDPGGAAGQPGESDLDLYEAVLRHLLPRCPAGAGVYVELPDGNPAQPLCDRFKGQPVPVQPLPPGGAGALPPGSYVVRMSSVSGEKVQWQGPDEARVFVLDYPAGQALKCGTPYPITVRRANGRWVVTAS